MNSAVQCRICQEAHKESKCPELTKELEPGFYKPAGGYSQGGGDEDEKLKQNLAATMQSWVVTHSLTRVLNTSSDLLAKSPAI